MRYVGFLLLILAGGSCGFLTATQLRRRAQVLETTVCWIRYLQTEFRFHATPLVRALEACACQPAFRELTFLRESVTLSGSPAERLNTAIRQQARPLGLTVADVEMMTQLCAGLGVTDLEGQLSHLEIYAARLELQQTQAWEQYRCKGKVYRVLGLGASLAVALVLW